MCLRRYVALSVQERSSISSSPRRMPPASHYVQVDVRRWGGTPYVTEWIHLGLVMSPTQLSFRNCFPQAVLPLAREKCRVAGVSASQRRRDGKCPSPDRRPDAVKGKGMAFSSHTLYEADVATWGSSVHVVSMLQLVGARRTQR